MAKEFRLSDEKKKNFLKKKNAQIRNSYYSMDAEWYFSRCICNNKIIRGSKVFKNFEIFGIEFGFCMIWAEMDNILLDLHNSFHNVGSLIQ